MPIEVRVLADQLALIPQGHEWAGGITILFSTAEPKGRFSNIDKKQGAIRMKEKPKPGEFISYNVDLVFRSNDQIVSVAVIDNVSQSVGYAREWFAKVQQGRGSLTPESASRTPDHRRTAVRAR